MGLFFNSGNEVQDKIIKEFGKSEGYLVAEKYNKPANSLIKFLLYQTGWILDQCRQFILYFNEKGVYVNEISNSLNGTFRLMPWSEIEKFIVEDKGNKARISIIHLDKEFNYEIFYKKTNYLKGNRERFMTLKNNNFNKID
ncbi:hypothetical protein SAMN05421767_12121 [Granulicatella balaenopterae]|uniref:Uncharacterized protein n=1 Tax=Granulicatella balaenopterae TaxID=137733 RepID=A0A1H9LTX3_9LACT|nr:hypothetical protein [Granulicatella balaenopterae]SER14313.1 hypothetical protein SAMN05421767_12121 [Granulicatella balaenopterae]